MSDLDPTSADATASDKAPTPRTLPRRKVTASIAAAVALVAATGLGAGLATSPDPAVPAKAPSATALDEATVVCPAVPKSQATKVTRTLVSQSGTPDDGTIKLNRNSASGQAQVTREPRSIELAANTATEIGEGAPSQILNARGKVAIGINAISDLSSPRSLATCGVSVGESWFTGVSAGPERGSVIEITNPSTSGRAVVDVTVLDDAGVLDTPRLRGIGVEAGATTVIDLSEEIPTLGTLALRADVVRGRASVVVRDQSDPAGSTGGADEWLGASNAPAREIELFGVNPGTGSHTLVVANPGTSEVRAELEFVEPGSTFKPTGVEPIRINPQAVAVVDLGGLLRSDATAKVVGISITASAPVTAALRSEIDDDPMFVVDGGEIASYAYTATPAGKSTLTLGGATSAGVVTLIGYDDQGKEELNERVEVTPGRAATVKLSSKIRALKLEPARTTIRATLSVKSGAGVAALALREAATSVVVPALSWGRPAK